ncbi:hypothetical protein KP509_03G102600 [Ceratopteris richardii]|uniref:Uncharacterized protein n=1 Tax=Ceratopteris richardii TaxID=49495 RepID=A0A8T2VAF3_CERRI|nr:hypothetical protein KP509_03G102600 [Ceratopteris richardii]
MCVRGRADNVCIMQLRSEERRGEGASSSSSDSKAEHMYHNGITPPIICMYGREMQPRPSSISTIIPNSLILSCHHPSPSLMLFIAPRCHHHHQLNSHHYKLPSFLFSRKHAPENSLRSLRIIIPSVQMKALLSCQRLGRHSFRTSSRKKKCSSVEHGLCLPPSLSL